MPRSWKLEYNSNDIQRLGLNRSKVNPIKIVTNKLKKSPEHFAQKTLEIHHKKLRHGLKAKYDYEMQELNDFDRNLAKKNSLPYIINSKNAVL